MTRPIAETAVAPHTSTGTNLDAAFGEALPPSYIDEDKLEISVRPRSRQQLDEESSKLLSKFMSTTVSGLGITVYVYCVFPILWVVDDQGQLWFSLEEVVKLFPPHDYVLPRASDNKTVILEVYRRIGHPSLIGGAPGRIGGEILFDEKRMAWEINNRSGRYGTRPGRRQDHLANASKKFAAYGIHLFEDFHEPPTGRQQ